jgi:hypothetical protein
MGLTRHEAFMPTQSRGHGTQTIGPHFNPIATSADAPVFSNDGRLVTK